MLIMNPILYFYNLSNKYFMKKLILFSILSTFVFFTNCKKKSDEPTPNSSSQTTIKNENILIDNGSTMQLNTKLFSKQSRYEIVGYATSGAYQSILVRSTSSSAFTTSATVDLSSTSILQLSYTNASGVYYANSGTAELIVSDTATYILFTNIVFKKSDASNITVQYSGQLSINANTPEAATTEPTAVTTGSVFYDGANRTLNVNININPNQYSLDGRYSNLTLGATFFPERPQSSRTVDLSSTTSGLSLSYTNGLSFYKAVSGTANITVNGTALTVSFTNAVFKQNNSTTTTTVTGSLSTSK